MTDFVRLLGIDPGFASIGFAVVRLYPDREEIESLTVFTTEKAEKKRKVLASDDNFRRARSIAEALGGFLGAPQVEAICAESMSFPRSSSVAAKMAMCWGVLAAFAFNRGIPVLQATPKEIKKKLCGNGSASKDDIEAALVARHGRSTIEEALVKGFVTRKGDREHPLDALAAVVACLDSEVVRMARRMAACEG